MVSRNQGDKEYKSFYTVIGTLCDLPMPIRFIHILSYLKLHASLSLIVYQFNWKHIIFLNHTYGSVSLKILIYLKVRVTKREVGRDLLFTSSLLKCLQ